MFIECQLEYSVERIAAVPQAKITVAAAQLCRGERRSPAELAQIEKVADIVTKGEELDSSEHTETHLPR